MNRVVGGVVRGLEAVLMILIVLSLLLFIHGQIFKQVLQDMFIISMFY